MYTKIVAAFAMLPVLMAGANAAPMSPITDLQASAGSVKHVVRAQSKGKAFKSIAGQSGGACGVWRCTWPTSNGGCLVWEKTKCKVINPFD